MALIEYRTRKSGGKTVLNPVILKLDAGDRVRFRTSNNKTQLVLDDPLGYLTFMVTQPMEHPEPLATLKGNTLVVGVKGNKVKKASGVALASALGGGLGDDTGGGLGDDTGGGAGGEGGGAPPTPQVLEGPKPKTKRKVKKGV